MNFIARIRTVFLLHLTKEEFVVFAIFLDEVWDILESQKIGKANPKDAQDYGFCRTP